MEYFFSNYQNKYRIISGLKEMSSFNNMTSTRLWLVAFSPRISWYYQNQIYSKTGSARAYNWDLSLVCTCVYETWRDWTWLLLPNLKQTRPKTWSFLQTKWPLLGTFRGWRQCCRSWLVKQMWRYITTRTTTTNTTLIIMLLLLHLYGAGQPIL